tara:strand:+ start:2770 stop:3285 length:516 start_codon:yes stop_codon:yes gene_type:complete
MGDAVDDAYEKSQREKATYVEVERDIVDARLISELKVLKDEVNTVYSKLIANPYLAPDLVEDARSTLVRTAAVLMEYGIPLQHEGKKKTPDDIIRESLAQLAGLLGAKGAGAALRAKRSFQDAWEDLTASEDFVIYEDEDEAGNPNGEYYFIDPESGEEFSCDRFGNPLEE